jgi:hypothetical protein
MSETAIAPVVTRKVRVLRPAFYVSGRIAVTGEILELPLDVVSSLITARKVEPV